MKALTLARRELTGYLYSPIAYVIGAGFLLLTAGWFFLNLRIGDPQTAAANLNPV